jgi:hypothetical protein
MISEPRQAYNKQYSAAAYSQYCSYFQHQYPNAIDFRLAETPVFISKSFVHTALATCEHIIDMLVHPDFNQLSQPALPPQYVVPNQNGHPEFLCFDFGICSSLTGEIVPQLVEMQGFPSLFAFQILMDEAMQHSYQLPQLFTPYLNNFNKETYLHLLKTLILGNEIPESVVLLELFPNKQKTRIDFYCTQQFTGVAIVCLTELVEENNQLFYIRNHQKIRIKRIYNRIVFDELAQQTPDIQSLAHLLFKPLEVSWVVHPNWFYRISKYLLPYIKHNNVPEAFFVNELTEIPENLENFVLKPLFSFGGQGVVMHVTPQHLTQINHPEHWILQKKVTYAPCIPSPDGVPSKAEVRFFYFWPPDSPRPIAVGNLARLTKGEMIGVGYNQDSHWVGGSIAYFPQ